jgi:transcriptional regulator with XRE-family HTH domain
MSQAQLAVALKTTQSAVSLYEAGERGVGWDLLFEIARQLDRPLGYFLDERTGGPRYPRGGRIAEFIDDLHHHPDDLPELAMYWKFLRSERVRR